MGTPTVTLKSAKLATGSVTSDALLAANVVTAAIADDAITSAKITGLEMLTLA